MPIDYQAQRLQPKGKLFEKILRLMKLTSPQPHPHLERLLAKIEAKKLSHRQSPIAPIQPGRMRE